MELIIPIDTDSFKAEDIKNLELYTGKSIRRHYILMGSNTDVIKKLIKNAKTINCISDDYNFSRGVYKSLKMLKNIISANEPVMICMYNFMWIKSAIIEQIGECELNKEFIYIPIYEDTSRKNFGITDHDRI